MSAPLLELRGVVKEYVVPGGGWRKSHLRAVDGVDLTVGTGELVGLVGESGSGKSTLARCALGLAEVAAGSVTYDGIDVLGARGEERRRLRRELQLVFQSPVAALDPRMTVEKQVAEPLTTHRLVRGAALGRRVAELLEHVGLASDIGRKLPHQLSGGQAQRVVIARALSTRPKLLVLDEPTSSLDVVVQAQILNLLLDLQRQHGISYLLISHDISVIRHLSERVAVMYLGRVVEEGETGKVLAEPLHPYTRALVSSVRGGGRATLDAALPLAGETPPAWAVPEGCRFHPRCGRRAELGSPPRCSEDDPRLDELEAGHLAACHYPYVADGAAPATMSASSGGRA